MGESLGSETCRFQSQIDLLILALPVFREISISFSSLSLFHSYTHFFNLTLLFSVVLGSQQNCAVRYSYFLYTPCLHICIVSPLCLFVLGFKVSKVLYRCEVFYRSPLHCRTGNPAHAFYSL